MKGESRAAVRRQGALKKNVELETGFAACFQTEDISGTLDGVRIR